MNPLEFGLGALLVATLSGTGIGLHIWLDLYDKWKNR